MIARSMIGLALALCCYTSSAEEPISIPLDQIWGCEIFGTGNIKDLEPEIDTNVLSREEILQKSLIQQIRRSLSSYRRHQNKGTAGTSFIVGGTGSAALSKAHSILVEGHDRAESFNENEELTLVFYCYEFGRYVRLDQVFRSGSKVKVRYHFVAHNTRNMSTHFALIPLGKMPAGTSQVEIEQLPSEGPDWGPKAAEVSGDLLRSLVCEPTTFVIR